MLPSVSFPDARHRRCAWQEVLHAYPQIIVDPLDSGVVRVRLSGDAYNRKTLNRVKKSLPKPQVGVCAERIGGRLVGFKFKTASMKEAWLFFSLI